MPAPRITRDELLAETAYEYHRLREQKKNLSKVQADYYEQLKALVPPHERFDDLPFDDWLITAVGIRATDGVDLDEEGLLAALNEEQRAYITRPRVVLGLLDQAVKDKLIPPTLVNKFSTQRYKAPSVAVTVKKKPE